MKYVPVTSLFIANAVLIFKTRKVKRVLSKSVEITEYLVYTEYSALYKVSLYPFFKVFVIQEYTTTNNDFCYWYPDLGIPTHQISSHLVPFHLVFHYLKCNTPIATLTQTLTSFKSLFKSDLLSGSVPVTSPQLKL